MCFMEKRRNGSRCEGDREREEGREKETDRLADIFIRS